MSDKFYTKEEVRQILHSITYEDILEEDEYMDIIKTILRVYEKARKRNTPDCLIKAGIHNAVEIGCGKYYELGGN